MCECVCLLRVPLPVTSLDRWHPLALWLACQRLNMSMGALLQASTFIYKCKFKPLPLILPPSHTCTTLPLTVQDWFGCFPFAETVVERVLGSLRTLANNHEMFQIHQQGRAWGRKWQSQNVPIKKTLYENHPGKFWPPYFFFHILMMHFCGWVLIRAQKEMTGLIRF